MEYKHSFLQPISAPLDVVSAKCFCLATNQRAMELRSEPLTRNLMKLGKKKFIFRGVLFETAQRQIESTTSLRCIVRGVMKEL